MNTLKEFEQELKKSNYKSFTLFLNRKELEISKEDLLRAVRSELMLENFEQKQTYKPRHMRERK